MLKLALGCALRSGRGQAWSVVSSRASRRTGEQLQATCLLACQRRAREGVVLILAE
jgi:hypothetical protein